MRLNRSTFLLLIGSLIVIGLAFVLINNQTSAPDDTPGGTVESGTEQVFPDVALLDVTGLRVRDNVADAQTVISQAEDNAWQLDETADPAPGTLAQPEIDDAITTLVELTTTDRFAPENELAVYGLESPAYTVEFNTEETTYSLQIGDSNTAGTRYYAFMGDDTDTIHLLSNKDALDRVLEIALAPPYIIEPTATPEPSLNLPGPIFTGYGASLVNRFIITDESGDNSLTFVKGADETWSLMQEPDTALESEIVQIAVATFGSLRAVDGLPGDSLEQYGLDEPSYTLSAETDARTYRLQIGDTDISETRYYTLVDDFEPVAVIEADSLAVILDLLTDPPYAPETTPETTAEATAETTPEAD